MQHTPNTDSTHYEREKIKEASKNYKENKKC